MGAAIAAGSHLEKGTWALFVMAARRRVNIMAVVSVEGGENVSQCPCLIMRLMARSSMASPIRLVRAVIMPAASDFGF